MYRFNFLAEVFSTFLVLTISSNEITQTNKDSDSELPNLILDPELAANGLEDFFENKKPETHLETTDVIGEPLSAVDFEAGLNLTEEDMSSPLLDPIQSSGYFEGDIKEPDFLEGRNAMNNPRMKWIDGVIPYVISNNFDGRERSLIARAMEEYHRRTCIRFVPRRGHQDYVFITRGNGCFSMIGRVGGEQMLSLDNDCVYFGIIIHEFMHAVGFWHEQSRTDRDDFVQILWDNIQRGQQYNFAKYSDGRLQHLGERYDYDSIMHYGMYEFSVGNNRPTVLPRAKNVPIGQRRGFSQTDVRKINKLYACGTRRRGNRLPSHRSIALTRIIHGNNKENEQNYVNKEEMHASRLKDLPQIKEIYDQAIEDEDIGDSLNEEDFRIAAVLPESAFEPKDGEYPITKSGHFEGDIQMKDGLSARNAVRNKSMIWKDAEVPYTMSKKFGSHQRGVIARAVQHIQNATCVKFVQRKKQRDYIHFGRGDGCSSFVGMEGGKQLVSLDVGCVYVGVVVHELMHALGFWHEHSRADRDDYITVLWENIEPGMEYNFDKFTWKEVQHLGMRYDYDSIMHYEATAFSKDPSKPTIVPKAKNVTIGQSEGLSKIDRKKINKLYEC